MGVRLHMLALFWKFETAQTAQVVNLNSIKKRFIKVDTRRNVDHNVHFFNQYGTVFRAYSQSVHAKVSSNGHHLVVDVFEKIRLFFPQKVENFWTKNRL